MDRFLTHEGLQPFYLGDIDFMSGVFRDTIAKIVSGLGLRKSSFILSGFNVNSSYDGGKVKYAWDDGAVVIDGEIYSVSAGSLAYDPNSGPMQSTIGLKIEIGYDPSGRRPLKSGEMVECWQKRTAVVKTSNFDVSLRSLRRFEELLTERVTKDLPPFKEVDLVDDREPVFCVSGASAGVGSVEVKSISGALYLLFGVKLLMEREEHVSVFIDADFEFRDVEQATGLFSILKKGTSVFMLPVVKNKSEVKTYDNILCTADITGSEDSGKIHIRIAPAAPVECSKIQGKCFIRL